MLFELRAVAPKNYSMDKSNLGNATTIGIQTMASSSNLGYSQARKKILKSIMTKSSGNMPTITETGNCGYVIY